jgi:hypothetical protein
VPGRVTERPAVIVGRAVIRDLGVDFLREPLIVEGRRLELSG